MAMIYCCECGYKHSDRAQKCPKCGAPLDGTLTRRMNKLVDDRSMVVYLILAWFLGVFGVHRFYAKKTGSAIAMLIMGTIGWLLIIPGIAAAIWALIDFIVGLCHVSDPEYIFNSQK